VVENNSLFHVNSKIHSINTRQNFNRYQSQANLTLYQEGVYYSRVKVFNNLPPNIRNLFSDVKRFKLELGKYLHPKSFYTLEECYNQCFFLLGGCRGMRIPKHFVNLTEDSKNFKMLEFPFNQLQTYYGYLCDLLSFM
jgi:hypothetical protein